MSLRNSFAAIKEIKSWTVEDVVTVLNKNGLESTCAAFQRREIDGENLLGLTEGKLALWKRDLSLADIRKLLRFMNELNKSPERFLLFGGDGDVKQTTNPVPSTLPPLPPLPQRPPSRTSDTGSWDTDFDDDHDPAEDVYSEPPDEHPPQPNPGFLNTRSLNDIVKPPIARRPAVVPAAMWSHQGNVSALFSLPKPPTPHLENLISNLNLKGQEDYEDEEYTSIEEGVGCNLESLGFAPPIPSVGLPPRKIAPTIQPPLQPTTLPPRKLTPVEQPSHESIRASSPIPYPKISFNAPRSRPPAVLPPTKQDEPHFNNIPAGIPNQMSALSNKNQPPYGVKPPMPLPVHNQGSSLSVDTAGSTEGANYELEDYESIDTSLASQGVDYYLQPFNPSITMSPSLPARSVPPEIVTPSSRPPSPPRKKSFPDEVPCADGTGGKLSDKLRILMKMRQVSTTSATDEPLREKSPMPEVQKPPPVERPGPGPRPLPPTPDSTRKPGQDKMNPRRNSKGFTQMAWYHNVDRKRAEEMLKNGEDGKFLLRPSMQTQNPLTLTLWYNKRLYNISVRQRADQRYALGTEKPSEQSFTSVEELVQHYRGEELVLYSGGERTGKTLLTSSPSRQSS